jgi:hypothetical protein
MAVLAGGSICTVLAEAWLGIFEGLHHAALLGITWGTTVMTNDREAGFHKQYFFKFARTLEMVLKRLLVQ